MKPRSQVRLASAVVLLTLIAAPVVEARDEAELPRERPRRSRVQKPPETEITPPPVPQAMVPTEPLPQPAAPAPDTTAPAAAVEPDAVTRELIDLLSAKGLIERADAERLLGKLREQAAARVAATPAAPALSPEAAEAAARASAPGGPQGPKPGTVRVVYLPEPEKQRIEEQIRQEVMDTARRENWAQPDALPEWTKRFTLGGDLRVREELVFFDDSPVVVDGVEQQLGNAPFVDFNAINAGAPYDVSQNNINPPPLRNTTEDRSQPRLRLRLNTDIRIDDGLNAHVRLASGNVRNPVSTNVTLGNSFSNFQLFIDRAYFDWRPTEGLELAAGRMPNPWLGTFMLWDEDLNFDGGTLRYSHPVGPLEPFVTVGAYSVQNTDFDFPSLRSDKIRSRDKYLYGIQLGTWAPIREESSVEAGVAYHYYDKINGERSQPCLALVPEDPCSTDQTRSGFTQGGNTMFAIRDLVADPSNPDGPQFQYFGLASPFRQLTGTTRFDFVHGGGIHTLVTGEYVVNLGYRRSRVLGLGPVNNIGDDNRYDGGRHGYLLNVLVGHPVLRTRGQWNVEGGYRHVESDAVVDAFNDSDFHLGGTNAQGYSLFARYAVGRDTWLTTRWLSATEISGAPLAIDVLQLDLQARF